MVVGGLGLGYTARAVLENAGVRSLIVVDALAEVIEWHEQGLLPLGKELTGDPRCRFVNGDFFAMSSSVEGFDHRSQGRRFDAVLVDIDHSPRKLLHPRHAALYEPEGLARLAGHLNPGGVFALWSNDPPDDAFERVLADAFATQASHVVTFDNLRGDHDVSNTVYVAVKADLPSPRCSRRCDAHRLRSDGIRGRQLADANRPCNACATNKRSAGRSCPAYPGPKEPGTGWDGDFQNEIETYRGAAFRRRDVGCASRARPRPRTRRSRSARSFP